ncbi:MAG: VWA domain-containing protein [Acidobacteriota bacterium]
MTPTKSVSRWLVAPTVLLGMALLAMSLTVPSETVAQEAEPEEGAVGKLFVDRVDVNVINVEVFVTDKKGNRIKGLDKDDFELFEDGKPIKITNFYAVEEGKPVEEVASPPAPAPKVEREPLLELRRVEQQDPRPQEQQLHLVVYFDNLFLKPFSRNKVIRQTRQFLRETVTPGDRVQLVTFDRSLHVRHRFTTDVRAISDALFELEELSGFAVQKDADRKDVLLRFDAADTAIEAENIIDFYAKALHFDVQLTIRNLKEMVNSLAGLPGRKAILHVSDGIPMTAAEDLYFMIDNRFGDAASGASLRSRYYDVRRLVNELTAAANANRVTFYTLEAAGLRSHTSLSAEYSGGVDSSKTVSGSRAEADFIRIAGQQETLMMMAHDTGGKAVISTNNIGLAFNQMGDDFRNYYSLGYSPAHSGDGRYHDIEVRVKRKGLKVRHRKGYRDKTPETHLSEGTLAALLYGYETNPMEVELRFNSVRRNENNQFLLPIEVRVPLGKAALIPQTEAYQGRLRFSVAVIDEDGRMSPVEQTPVPLVIPGAEIENARGQYYVYTAELLMRRGRQSVAVGVRDEIASESSYVRRPIQIGSSRS